MILTFNEKPTDQLVRQQVIERLRGVDLPPGVEPEIAPLATAIGEIFRFRLRGDHLSPQELRTLQDWVVEKQLRLVPGVADVVTMGGTMKQYEVNPDLAQHARLKVTLAQLFTALTRANANAGGGARDPGPPAVPGAQPRQLPHLGATSARWWWRRTRARRSWCATSPQVRVGSAPAQGLVGQDDADDIVNGIVVMRKGENPSRVLEGDEGEDRLRERATYCPRASRSCRTTTARGSSPARCRRYSSTSPRARCW